MNLNLLLIFLVSLLNTSLVHIGHAKQGDALTKLMKAKKGMDPMTSSVDTGLYETRIVAGEFDSLLVPRDGSKEEDRIWALPGQPENVDFQQYGGYVTVDAGAGRALYYYFAEAVGFKQGSRPLLLWLNGGPGCSSLGYGAMEELGPFRVKSDGKTLYRNPFAWNNVANVLFLESPAGVGYSYSNTTLDYKLSGDRRTAEDAYTFIVNWLEKFPEYKSKDLYIAGESYAGHYVPQLAHTILAHNKLKNKTFLNLKGIALGNAVINDETDELGMFDYLWTHALASDESIGEMHKYCDFSPNATTQPRQCINAADNIGGSVSSINIYNIYAPLCRSTHLTDKPKRVSIMRFDPCTDHYVENYLNLPQVQEALHANVTKLNYRWTACSGLTSQWRDSPATVLPLIQEFMANGIRVWVYSGDTDGRVPVTSTRYSVDALKLPIKTPWKPWFHNNEVGGYSIVYKGDLTLATVRGAGHEVPSYQPHRALKFITYFLQGKPLPTS